MDVPPTAIEGGQLSIEPTVSFDSDARVYHAIRWSPDITPPVRPHGDGPAASSPCRSRYRMRCTRVSSKTGSADS
jgi:hypothetical protein